MASLSLSFTRTRTTWLGYFLLGYHTLLQALVSAVVPFLRSELQLNYTRASLYMSANALGMVLAGITGARLADRLGRRTALWGAAGGTVLGLLALTLGQEQAITLAGALGCGFAGSLCMVMVQAILSDEHGERRAVALSEANVAAGLGSLVAPLLASGAVAAGLGWRAAPGLLPWLVVAAGLSFGRAPIPAPLSAGGVHSGLQRLGRVFWMLWGVLFLSVSVEWGVIFWSADFLEKIAGFPRAVSVSLLGVYFVAAALGRFLASRLVRRLNASSLLFGAMSLAALGILIVWLAPWPLIRLSGLFLCGLGTGNLFPLGVIETVSAASQAANLASSRATLAAGLAIFCSPLILGLAADQVGIRLAYGLTLPLLALAAALAFWAFRRRAGF